MANDDHAFALHASLAGPRDSVLCLSLNGRGEVLASGGLDGLYIWDMKTLKHLSCPTGRGRGHRGGVTAMIWLQPDDDYKEYLVYGTERGWLVAWIQRPAGFEEVYCARVACPSEITGLAYDPHTSKLGLCNRDGVVQLYMVAGSFKLTSVFSVKIDDFLPKALAFGKMEGDVRAIMVFGLHCGRIHFLHKKTGEIVFTKDAGAMIGNIAMSEQFSTLLLDLPEEGAALYRLGEGIARMKTFRVPVLVDRRPRQVSLGENDSIVISGSDHGRVYVWGRRDGRLIDELKLKNSNWCQTVLAGNILGRSAILAAQSANVTGLNVIYIWTRKAEVDCTVKVTEKKITSGSTIMSSRLCRFFPYMLVAFFGIAAALAYHEMDRIVLAVFEFYLKARVDNRETMAATNF